MNPPAGIEQIPAVEVRHGDVVQDPGSGKWLTVTRIVDSDVKVQDEVTPEVVSEYIAFYGDERLNEQIVLDGPDRLISRRVRQ
jgi:hypothetical protein